MAFVKSRFSAERRVDAAAKHHPHPLIPNP